MLEAVKQYLFLVVDQETFGVITRCPTISIANAVSKGILNSSPMVIFYPYTSISGGINAYRDDISLNYQLVRRGSKIVNTGFIASECNVAKIVEETPSKRFFDLVEYPKEFLSQDWYAKRWLANARADAIMVLEQRCERYLSRSKYFIGDEMFLQFLGKELDLCDPKTTTYTPAIQEWADINNRTVDAAYQELKMNYESSNISVMRIHALWNKYVEIINSKTEKSDMDNALFMQLESEFRFGSRQ
jgi:hypothetical protein